MKQLSDFHKAYVYHDPKLREYGVKPPFSPGQPYPEYTLGDAGSAGQNRVYDAVRSCLHLMGLDADHFGTPVWNPLGESVWPSMRRRFWSGLECVKLWPNGTI